MKPMAGFFEGRYSLMRAGESWGNAAGMRTLGVTFVALSALLTLGGSVRVPVISALIHVICVLLLFMGGTAAGMQFMEQAAGRVVRGTAQSLMGSPVVLLRSIGLAAGIAAGACSLTLVAALLLALCRVPALGEVLYIAVLPIVTMLGAFGVLVMLAAVMLAVPSLWEGHSLRTAGLQLWAVATQRPFEAFWQLAALALLGLLVTAVIGVLAGVGFAIAMGLSAFVLVRSGMADPQMERPASTSWLGMLGSGDMLGPGAVGVGIVLAIVVALVMAVMYLGLSLVHLKLTAGLDLACARESVGALFRRGHSAQRPPLASQLTTAGGAETIDPDSVPFLVDGSTILPLALGCPRCMANVSPGDQFCASCGHKLA